MDSPIHTPLCTCRECAARCTCMDCTARRDKEEASALHSYCGICGVDSHTRQEHEDRVRAEKVESLLQEKWKEDRAVDSLPVEPDSPFLREKALLLAIDIRAKELSNDSLQNLTQIIHNWLLKGTL